MQEWLTSAQLSKLEGVPNNTIRQRIRRNKYTLVQKLDNESEGRFGTLTRISLDDPEISETIRQRYYLSQRPSPAADRIKAPAQPSLEPSVNNISAGEGDLTLLPHSLPKMVPEKLRISALAKYDLVIAWRQHRRSPAQPEDKLLLEADQEFEKAYNMGLLLPQVYKILGSVDIKSVYRWNRALNGASNYMPLVSLYTCEKKEPSLTREEKETFQDSLLQPNRLNIGEATKITKTVLVKRGIKSPSSQRKFRRWAEWFKGKNSDVWTLMREGQKALKDKEIFSIKRDVSKLEVGDVLIADGKRLDFQVINPFTGKPCRATLIGYLDWKSFDLAGYDIMLEENIQVIASALRNGIIRLGKVPKIAYSDNGRSFRAKFFTDSVDLEEAGLYGLFGRLGIKPVFAMPYNARAKLIERFFKEFSKFERLLPSFTGASIDDKPAYLKRNETFHKAHHNGYIPTIEETVRMVDAWIKEYLEIQPCPHVKGKTIGEAFQEGQGPGVNVADLDELMMAQEIKTIRANGIRFLGADYYNDALYGLRERVVVKYSLSDLSYVKIYNQDSKFLATAKRVIPVHPMARYLGDVKDVTELKHQQSRQKSLEKVTMNAAKELIAQGKDTPPWLDIVPMTPNMIGQLEATATSFRQEKEEKSILQEVCKEDPFPLALETGQETNLSLSSTPTENQTLREIQADQQNKSSNDETPHADGPLMRPFFDNAIDRYKWHLEHGHFSEEDERWVAWFKTTPDYDAFYLFFEQQQEEYLRKEALQYGGQVQCAE